MSPPNRTVPIPEHIVIDRGATRQLPELLERGGFGSSLLVTGSGFSSRIGSRLIETLGLERIEHMEVDAEANLEEVTRLAEGIERPDVILGCGGGRPIDVAKTLSHILDVACLSIPTALSHDGIGSPVCSLRDETGRSVSFGGRMPFAVVVDLDLVASAPHGMTQSGIGDLMSNLTAVADWRLAADLGHDRYDEYSATIALQAAQAILFRNEARIHDIGFLDQLGRSLVMSGLAMSVAGTSRPASGAEHLISHALDRLLLEQARPHGIQVALGLLVAAEAHGLGTEIRPLFKAFGVPTHPHEVGISLDDMVSAVSLAPETRPDRYTVLTPLVRAGRSRRLVADTFPG